MHVRLKRSFTLDRVKPSILAAPVRTATEVAFSRCSFPATTYPHRRRVARPSQGACAHRLRVRLASEKRPRREARSHLEAESYVVRIYRRGSTENQSIVGVIEAVNSGWQKP